MKFFICENDGWSCASEIEENLNKENGLYSFGCNEEGPIYEEIKLYDVKTVLEQEKQNFLDFVKDHNGVKVENLYHFKLSYNKDTNFSLVTFMMNKLFTENEVIEINERIYIYSDYLNMLKKDIDYDLENNCEESM